MRRNKDVQISDAVLKRRGFRYFLKENTGFLYILPWLIGFLVFKLYPFGSSLYYSFTDYDLFKDIVSFIGFKNYTQILDTAKIRKAFEVTFRYAFMTVPLKLAFALFVAYILNFKIKGVNLFRTIYYIPSILGGSVAIAVLWKFLFQNNGLINQILSIFNVVGPNWLGDSRYSLFVVSLLRVWQFGSPMVIFLAALKSVPTDLYEAASIDGASKTRQFLSVTIPLISPVIFYNLVTQLCQAFQEFNAPYIITDGGPLGSTTLISMLVYQNAFKTYQMGLASAISWLLFLIVMTLTIISFMSQKYWVYYSDDEGR
ncbi:sugar ABC transporter permease [Anaerocolumna cellulosilytica]|uniref:Sugar ABC transporter permease n=1 Tax=Anaerocolumna cellulosilytica TaxID=433286 RepID=A0A6S6R7Z2_9FIRM|nr:sugar ABC transporter permease [Anaerocolumna cellulosilytica]MBB5197603.1 oligogalacturonide transport system permease protein [Anaerocolumna cellulosilytica]BCJ95128.1 sugar ABC transporter permease [Anaerocolumna cellulosilytica]